MAARAIGSATVRAMKGKKLTPHRAPLVLVTNIVLKRSQFKCVCILSCMYNGSN